MKIKTTLIQTALMLIIAASCYSSVTIAANEPRHTYIENCSVEEGKRVFAAVRHMRAATNTRQFRGCLKRAIVTRVRFYTSHEMDFGYGQTQKYVGPYKPCTHTTGIFGLYFPSNTLTDPKMVTIRNKMMAYDMAMHLLQDDNVYRRLQIRCHKGRSTARNIGAPWDYFTWSRLARRHQIDLSTKVFSQYPKHARDEINEIAYGNLGPSYPVDELAGIIAHEIVHSVGFHHGQPEYHPFKNNCGYTTNSGDKFHCGSSGTCRMNSLNEIVEGCMSEVVQKSTDRCNSAMCTDPDEVPMFIDGGCQCIRSW